MKRTTAIGHLVTLAAEASREHLPGVDRPLTELWAAGPILDPGTDTLDAVTVVFVLDLPVAQVPWRSRPPVANSLVARLRIDKNPVWPLWRPQAWPAWNVEFRRVARFWSAADGVDEGVMEALRKREGPVGHEPDAASFEAQMRVELEAARIQLDESLEGFYERQWQQDHKGFGLYPGDYLWWAAYAYREIDKALS